MATHLVNLDALIRREDFEISTDTKQSNSRLSTELRVEDLERIYLHLLRKPDFQRETSNWGPEKIADFIKSFVDGDLIPATIMWRSHLSGNIFVIDGAHRLSALMAWVHDDFGDGQISGPFFQHLIPPAQKKLAEQTRQLVNNQIGKYSHLKHIVSHPDESPNDEMLRRARNIGTFKVDLQWVGGDAAAAENSFFRINTGSSIIDPTELDILKARHRPNAIATRALMRSGTGHKYWSTFPEEARKTIEQLAREISDGLFKPLLETPIKTLDLPVAGQAYTAESFKMILDLVNLVNGVTPGMWQVKPGRNPRGRETALPDDTTGDATIAFLRKVKRASELISGNYPGSLGLHPVVYFYGATGRFQPTAFLAAIRFATELKNENRLNSFTKHRRDFEEFLVRHRDFTNQLTHSYGSRTRSLEPLLVMYRLILEELENGETDDAAIVRRLQAEPKLRELKVAEKTEGTQTRRRRFTTDTKSAAFIKESINTPIRCAVCGARLHVRSISADHRERVQDGGLGTVENAQMTHPYCNTGYKEAKVARAKSLVPESASDSRSDQVPISAPSESGV